MIKLGMGLNYYFIMCTLVTSLLVVVGNIRNKFKPKERREEERREANESLENSLSSLRMVFGDMDDNTIMTICLILDTYVPGLNFIVWKGLLLDILGLEAKS